VPQWPRGIGPPPNRDAVLAIVINEKGLVESARMTRAVHRTYDQLLLNAVSSWAYVPAQLAGEPVKFRKVMKLSFR
jgi:TonB family protein